MSLDPRLVSILRYLVPAIVGTIVGMYLEARFWRGTQSSVDEALHRTASKL
jgi:hypothetical protein